MKTLKNFFFTLLCLLITSGIYAQTVYDDQYIIHYVDISMASAITANNNGGQVFVGASNYTYGTTPHYGPQQIFVGKTQVDGTSDWLKLYDPQFEEGVDGFFPDKIVQLPEGGYVIGGTVSHSGFDFQNSFLMKINEYGDLQWFKKYDCYSFQNFFDLELCQCDGIADLTATADNGVAVVANLHDEGKTRTLIFKVDNNGTVTNAVNYFFSNDPGEERGIAIEAINDGFYVLAHSYESNNSGTYSQPLLIKLDHNFNHQWSRLFSDADDEYSTVVQITPTDMIVNDRQECIITGLRNTQQWPTDLNQIYLISIDQNGNTLWDNTLFFYKDNHNCGFKNPILEIDQNNNLYVSSRQETTVDYSSEIEYIDNVAGISVIKMNSGGTPQWYRLLEDDYNYTALNDMTIAQTPNGPTVGLVGVKEPNAVTAWVARLSGKDGSNDCYGEDALIYSKNVKYISLSCELGKNYHQVIGTDKEVPYFPVGYTRYRCGDDVQTEWSQSNNDQFLQSAPQNTTQAEAQVSGSVAPNPSNGQFTLSTELTLNGNVASVAIFDSVGKIIEQSKIDQTNKQFDLSRFPNGTYTIKVQAGNQVEQHKIIIQH